MEKELALISLALYIWEGFPCSSAGKESACNTEVLGSIPVLGRSPGEGKGYPLQYSGLENYMDVQSMGSQRFGHDWATELNWYKILYIDFVSCYFFTFLHCLVSDIRRKLLAFIIGYDINCELIIHGLYYIWGTFLLYPLSYFCFLIIGVCWNFRGGCWILSYDFSASIHDHAVFILYYVNVMYNKSPICEQILFWECFCKSNLFLSSTKLA